MLGGFFLVKLRKEDGRRDLAVEGTSVGYVFLGCVGVHCVLLVGSLWRRR